MNITCHFPISFTKAWLEKYGYAAEDDTPATGPAKLKDPSVAVRKFQQFVGLPVTGMFILLLH